MAVEDNWILKIDSIIEKYLGISIFQIDDL